MSQKGAKLGSGTFKGKLLNIFGGTRKVIGFICTILGPGVDPLGHPWPKQTDQPSACTVLPDLDNYCCRAILRAKNNKEFCRNETEQIYIS